MELTEEMLFWVALDRELAGARSETGYLIPSEVEAALTRWGIDDPDNREVARLMLDCLAAGRNEAANEDLEGVREDRPKHRPAKPRSSPRESEHE